MWLVTCSLLQIVTVLYRAMPCVVITLFGFSEHRGVLVFAFYSGDRGFEHPSGNMESSVVPGKVRIKDKFRPRTGHEGPEGE